MNKSKAKKRIVLGEGFLFPGSYSEKHGKISEVCVIGLQKGDNTESDCVDLAPPMRQLLKFTWKSFVWYKGKNKGKVQKWKEWRGPKVRLIVEEI